MKDKFPIRIVQDENEQRPFKAATSIDSLRVPTRNVRQELNYVEADYTILIRNVRDTLSISSKNRSKDPRLYWLVGDAILRFLDRMNELELYLAHQNRTLARETGLSRSSIEKILSFRRRFPRLSMVDPTITWARYREKKLPVPRHTSPSQ
jgi:hypothetical protein